MIKFLKKLFKRDEPVKVTVNVVVSDIYNFGNMRPMLEHELAKITSRGLKRRAPKY